ncbi:coiled-coil domain-containing protein 144A-like isoform X8 [Symphalangus syndactylus]|uniref:coiled-coil domain-containing protein 144A-like isoform X8 n=1 Tax=Symphalangus syndactylus TaxID=9590 RepID=UPI003007A7B1
MKRSSGLGGQKAQGPSGSFTCWWCCRGDDVAERDDSPFAQCGYNIREKHLGKLHRAASRGEVSKVERILSRGNANLDERDKKKRTALHLACANGHPEVVALLVDRGCQLDVFDNKNRTALLKAVQCQEKDCATILLEHGADPDFPDVYGNTTLHYATYNEDIPMTKKLLLHHANIETANKDELTPFLLAVHEEKQQMIEFLRKQKENLTAVKFESIQQVMFEYKENKTPRNPQNSNPVDEIPGNPVKRLFNKPSIDDSRPMSANEDFDFDTEEIVRQLQQELADTVKKQPISEPSLEATRCYVNLDETQDSKRKSGQIRSQADLTEAVETASSKGLHVDAEIEVLQQALLYMKTMQEKRETLQKDQEKLEEELVNLKSHMEMNVLERGELEHHKREFEERARQEIAEQLATAGLLLQIQKIADVKLQLLTEERKSTKKSQMELRIKELEFKLYKAKTSQADGNTTELEKYKELYLEELKLRESLSDELNKRKEILADVSSKLLQEKEWSGSLFTSHTTRPVLESACNGNLNEHLGLNRIHIPRENLRIPTLSSLSSNTRMESDLSKKTRTEDTFWELQAWQHLLML